MTEMPKPTEHHKRFEAMAGRWRGTETMYPSQWDPKGGTAQGRNDMRVAVANMRHVVVHIEVAAAIRIEQPHAFPFHDVHGLVVEQPVRITEEAPSALEKMFGCARHGHASTARVARHAAWNRCRTWSTGISVICRNMSRARASFLRMYSRLSGYIAARQ